MAEGADTIEAEVKPAGRVGRVKAGIGAWLENQMPPAATERYRRRFTVLAERLAKDRPELLEKLKGPVEAAAKAAGWAEPVGKVVLGTVALYGGINLLLHPEWFTAIGGVATKAWMAGTAAITGGFHYIVEKGGALVDRVKAVVGNILNPTSPFGGLPPDERGLPPKLKNSRFRR